MSDLEATMLENPWLIVHEPHDEKGGHTEVILAGRPGATHALGDTP